jgi:hypothetical protein
MRIRVPEKNKQPGLCYAVTDDGIELPVIDVTHQAFSDPLSADQTERLLQETVRATQRWTKAPRLVRWFFTQTVLRRGALTRGVVRCISAQSTRSKPCAHARVGGWRARWTARSTIV